MGIGGGPGGWGKARHRPSLQCTILGLVRCQQSPATWGTQTHQPSPYVPHGYAPVRCGRSASSGTSSANGQQQSCAFHFMMKTFYRDGKCTALIVVYGHPLGNLTSRMTEHSPSSPNALEKKNCPITTDHRSSGGLALIIGDGAFH